MSTIKRISISVPVQLADDLNYVHRRIGVSKSALVSTLLAEGIGDVRQLLESLPDEPTPDDLVRFRGESARLAESRVHRLRDMLGDD